METIKDQLEKAHIFYEEGLFAKAKGILFQLLREDINHSEVNVLLEKIFKKEYQALLDQPPAALEKAPHSTELLAHYKTLETLLGASLEDSQDKLLSEWLSEVQKDSQWMIEIEKMRTEMTLENQIDIGIAFLEMNLYQVAQKWLSVLFQQLEQKEDTGSDDFFSVAFLLVQIFLKQKKEKKALLLLEKTLHRSDLPKEGKKETLYWLGRLWEQKGSFDQAQRWYTALRAIDPQYRDVLRRIAWCRDEKS